MFTPLLVMALLLAWAGSFVVVYIGYDLGDKPTLIAGVVMLVLTSTVLIIH